ncbi:hypothetical protein BJ878DRAFT_496602 [Calycina marina]|uniref:Uncharacterized protein n=1 Tax=Calycina marina TaxID=1763456 RepID=A0A9P7Z7T2_9HELO|nr:hypothetical protein BJ878DRAFT_496602 [Calycina marina]
MFTTTKTLRQAASAARTPLIKFTGPRKWDSGDHARQAHPASPTHELPKDFSSTPNSASFSSYRQQAQQHGPLGASSKIGKHSGHSLGPVEPAKGEYFDRNELPARFRRTPIDLAEIDAIETGGAALWS